MTEALVLIDIQNDYFEGGKCPLKKTQETLKNILLLENHFHSLQKPVIYIQHISDGTTPFFYPNTAGAQLHESLSPNSNDRIVIKHAPNSFYNTDLMKILMEYDINELIVCGWMTHMCLDTTVRQAYDYGYKMKVISDGCTTKDLEWNNEKVPAESVNAAFLSALNSKFCDVMTTQKYMKSR